METTDQFSHRAVAEIDLAALRFNYRLLRGLAPDADMMAVVKADAYGHGAVAVSRTLAAEGCAHFGVATVSEAAELRAAEHRGRIYLLGGFFPGDARAIVALDLTPFVFDSDSIHAIGAAAAAVGRRNFPVHLKLDTGATRLGLRLDELAGAIDQLRRQESLTLEGVSTLLASAHDPTSPVTDRQLAEFSQALERLAAAGFAPPVTHVANSAALVLRADSHRNLVRPGLAIYGLPPVPAVAERAALRPAMTFKTRILQIKRVSAGTGVSYGHTFVTPRAGTIGVLAVGYADGYRRGLQHGGEVLIRGRRAPVVGAVCMDLTMVDLTEVPDARAGDEVILWGVSGGETISVNEVARLAQTISYEMLCTVGRRVARVYKH
ncbi:MAG TPA: alanine racemase [Candidatus Binataceae bacterium]|nr:alanine racemase [Candidatus Binataceae bacterium]